MKLTKLLFVALFFINVATAKSIQPGWHESLEVSFDQAQSQTLGRNSYYNYSFTYLVKSIDLTRRIKLSPRIFAELGLSLGGPEIEFMTGPSIVGNEEIRVDLNRWLSVRAKIEFADINPIGGIAYLYKSRDTQFQFSATARLKLLKPSDVLLEFDGELGDQVNRRFDLVWQLEQDVLNQFENYYLEPVLGVDLSYKFY